MPNRGVDPAWLRQISSAFPRAILAVLIAIATSGGPRAEDRTSCPADQWYIVAEEPGSVEAVCSGIAAASEFLAACGLEPSVPATTVRIVDTLPQICEHPAHALFDPGHGSMVVATADACVAAIRAGDLFDRLDRDTAYRSIVAHESAHVILFGSGLESFLEHEYLASVVQMDSLGSEARDDLMADLGIHGPVADAELDSMIYAIDPLRFAAKAYLHHLAQPDPCGQIRDIVSGRLRLYHRPGE